MINALLFFIVLLYIIFMFFFVRQNANIERKLFYTRINIPWKIIIFSIGLGVLGGLIASLLYTLLGIYIRPIDVVVLGALSFLLTLVNIRYLCTAFSGGLLVIVAIFVQGGVLSSNNTALSPILTYLSTVHIPSILASIGILHLLEAFLLVLQAGRGAYAALYSGQRGRLVGGYRLDAFWLLPIVTVLPATTGFDLSWLPEWWPLLNMEKVDHYTIALLPFFLSGSDIAIHQLPKQKARLSAVWISLFGLFMILLGFLTIWSLWVGMAGALFVIIAHEVYYRIQKYMESKANPIFTHSNQGLSILAILPNSPAAQMGLLPGETVQKVNGEIVNNTKEFYAALQKNAAFCKLEVVNLEGHIKFAQRSLYSGEHHLLGIIFAPGEERTVYAESYQMNLFQLITQRILLKKREF